MKLRFFSMILAAGLLLASPAWALDLHEARQAGLVGETLKGYISAVKEKPGTEVEALVEDVNARRREEYARISGENQQPVEVVAKLAAQQIINKLEPGEYYQDEDGAWQSRQ